MRREAEKAAAVVPAPAQVRVSRRARLAAHRAAALAAGWRAARAQSQWVDRAVDSCKLIRRVEDGCGRGLRKGVPMGPQTVAQYACCVSARISRLHGRSVGRQIVMGSAHKLCRRMQQAWIDGQSGCRRQSMTWRALGRPRRRCLLRPPQMRRRRWQWRRRRQRC